MKQILKLLFLFPIIGLFAGCCCRVEHAAKKPVPVIIDIHTHVFNAKYVPVAQIIVSRGVPEDVALILEDFLLSICEESELNERSPNFLPMANVSTSAQALYQRNLLPSAAAREAVIQSKFETVPLSAVLTPTQIARLDAYIRSQTIAPFAIAPNQPITSRDVANFLSQVQPMADDHSRHANSQTITPGAGGDWLRFFGTMLSSEEDIVGSLHQTYPQVDLFVGHLMDLEHSYGEVPHFPFAQQVTRMLALNRETEGKTLTFGMFDPFRGDAALDAVKSEYQAGVIGFKFYPPTGIRPAENLVPPANMQGTVQSQWDSRYKGKTADYFDALNLTFFEYCSQNDIPIFVHCTMDGFESVPGYGKMMCDPVWWKSIFARYPNLRVCFAHSGGDGGWFGTGIPPAPSGSFTEEVFDLCEKMPNVYCDVAYLEEILNNPGRNQMRDDLITLFKSRPAVAKKIMYGTDWHMITQVFGHEQYLNQFIAIFADPALIPYRSDFFAGNAARYLNLSTLSTDTRLDPTIRAALASIGNKLQPNR
jgi:predicted TIM-barrel fold metal-dependent hydrolase